MEWISINDEEPEVGKIIFVAYDPSCRGKDYLFRCGFRTLDHPDGNYEDLWGDIIPDVKYFAEPEDPV